MVRTKADSGARKAVAAKAPRKVLGSSSGGSSSSDSPSGKGAKHGGGNAVCVRPTPQWQKGIDSFFKSPAKSKSKPTEKENAEPEGSSSSQEVEVPQSSSSSMDCVEPATSSSSTQKNNLIESDEDE